MLLLVYLAKASINEESSYGWIFFAWIMLKWKMWATGISHLVKKKKPSKAGFLINGAEGET